MMVRWGTKHRWPQGITTVCNYSTRVNSLRLATSQLVVKKLNQWVLFHWTAPSGLPIILMNPVKSHSHSQTSHCHHWIHVFNRGLQDCSYRVIKSTFQGTLMWEDRWVDKMLDFISSFQLTVKHYGWENTRDDAAENKKKCAVSTYTKETIRKWGAGLGCWFNFQILTWLIKLLAAAMTRYKPQYDAIINARLFTCSMMRVILSYLELYPFSVNFIAE